MLTVDILKQNAALSALSDAQLNAIAEMSRNDENVVIGTRIGELHGRYDADILSITGIKKNDGEKSYEYTKRILNEYKTQVASHSTLKSDLDAANTKVAELNQKLENNAGDAVLKQQLKDAKAQITQLQGQLQVSANSLVEATTKNEQALKDVHVAYAFEAATAGIKFKAGIPESLRSTLLSSAKAEILAKGSLDVVETNGVQSVVLRDANGAIVNNVKNNLNPYTLAELVMESSLKDVIDTGRQQAGGGTVAGGAAGGGSADVFDISGAKTQIEADKMIETHLLSNGLTRDSAEFADKSLAMRNEAEVSKLPIK